MMRRIADMAPRKRHHLAAHMVNGTTPLSPQAAAMVLQHLRKSPDLRPGAQAAEPSRALHLGPEAHLRPASERPSPGVTTQQEARIRAQQPRRTPIPDDQDGIFYYRGRVYKVYHSQYDGKRRAKVLTISGENGVRGEWVRATRAFGFLREEDRMTGEQSREYEAMYGVTVCKHCGLPLENDESRARRSGPDCFAKHGD